VNVDDLTTETITDSQGRRLASVSFVGNCLAVSMDPAFSLDVDSPPLQQSLIARFSNTNRMTQTATAKHADSLAPSTGHSELQYPNSQSRLDSSKNRTLALKHFFRTANSDPRSDTG